MCCMMGSEAGKAGWDQIRQRLACLPHEFIFHLVISEEAIKFSQPESECFVIKICTLKKINQMAMGRWAEWKRDQSGETCSFIRSLLSTCCMLGPVLTAGYTEVNKTNPHGHGVPFSQVRKAINKISKNIVGQMVINIKEETKQESGIAKIGGLQFEIVQSSKISLRK